MMDQLNFAVLLVFAIFVYDASAAEPGPQFNVNWNYDNNSKIGPWNWKNVSSKCSGNRQSPINIVTEDVIEDNDLGPLVLGNYKHTMRDLIFELKNHGHSVNVELLRFNDWNISPVTIIYKDVSWRFSQFHFHFGSTDDQGSEHTIDGKAYPAEMHMIHYNTKYASLGEAAKMADGLLVWGHMIEIGTTPNTQLAKIIEKFQDVEFEHNVFNITTVFPTIDLIPEGSASSYYTYLGGLTTPTCDESVTWVVNTKNIVITSAQMNEFRKLRQTHNASDPSLMVNNYRPPQPLSGRSVYLYSNSNYIASSLSVNFLIALIYVCIF